MGKGCTIDIVDDEFSEAPIMASDTPLFLKEKHVTYWLRCLRSPLPHQYTSNDSNRMTLAFFTISALDLLGVLHTRTTPAEREEYSTWIYRCQHPAGGFRGFPGTDFGARGTKENAIWDPANIPATYFALSALCILGDDMSRVKRKECLQWLRRMQRPGGGSFGEVIGPDGNVEGGMDTRFGYCAMVIRWILRGNVKGDVEGVPDVIVDEMVECIKGSQTYDGGISEQPYHEAHAGFTYCAIGALYFLDRLPLPEGVKGKDLTMTTNPDEAMEKTAAPGLSSFDITVQWLVSRLTTSLDEDELDDEDYGDDHSVGSSTSVFNEATFESAASPSTSATSASSSEITPEKEGSFTKIRSAPASSLSDRREPSNIVDDPEVSTFDPIHSHWIGCSGRPNKLADTCYVFWVCGSLTIFNAIHLINPTPIRRYLCEKTQHNIAGGFGKLPGDPPDIYHSYLGLAALALLDVGYAGEEGVLARDTGSSSSSVSEASEAEDDPREFSTNVSLAQQRMTGEKEDRHQGLRRGSESSEPDEDDPNRRTNGRIVRRSRLGDIKIQSVKEDFAHKDGAGEGGEVGDGGGVLRRLDPALCISVRAREWLEGLSWRRAIVGESSEKTQWEAPNYPAKKQDWEWDE